MAVSGADLAAYAEKFLGLQYVWGGNSLQTGVDCSGLMQQVYKHFGLSIPRVTYDQIGQGQAIDQRDLQAGDLVFFDTDPGKAGPDHVGMYIGNGKFIEAPRPGEGVRISSLNSGYYQKIFMGGRRMAGVQGGGQVSVDGNTSGSVSTNAQKLSPDDLAAQYGWASGFLNSIPELKNLFKQAVANTWTSDQFQAKLRDTTWWKDNSQSMREAAALKATDPATWNANLNAMKVKIQQEAAAMGAAIPPNKLDQIAGTAISTGLDDNGLKNVLGEYVNFTANGTLNGAAGMYANNIKQYATSMGITLSDQTIKNQAALIARGLGTEEDYRAQIQQQASSMYPAYADAIAGGSTMSDIANPYIQIMSQSLGMNPATIGLNDPTIKAALNSSNAQGKPMGMSLTDFQNSIRSDPRWGSTQQAQDSVMNTGASVLRSMGLIS